MSMAALALPGAASAATAPKNIILNPGAEAGPGSTDGSTVPVPKWTVPKGGTFTAVQYGASGGFPTTTGPGPKDRGVNFFAGGEDPKTNTQKATQTDSLSAYAGVIAAGASYTLRGYFGGFSSQTDHASLTVTWESSAGATLGTATVGPVTEAARHGNTGLLARSVTGTVPAGSAKVLLTIECVRKSGAYDDGYADSLSLTIVASA
ncbi:MAG TPA: hypothetical protein VGH27_18920 [Streptosporangiaceae bacterium]